MTFPPKCGSNFGVNFGWFCFIHAKRDGGFNGTVGLAGRSSGGNICAICVIKAPTGLKDEPAIMPLRGRQHPKAKHATIRGNVGQPRWEFALHNAISSTPPIIALCISYLQRKNNKIATSCDIIICSDYVKDFFMYLWLFRQVKVAFDDRFACPKFLPGVSCAGHSTDDW